MPLPLFEVHDLVVPGGESFSAREPECNPSWRRAQEVPRAAAKPAFANAACTAATYSVGAVSRSAQSESTFGLVALKEAANSGSGMEASAAAI